MTSSQNLEQMAAKQVSDIAVTESAEAILLDDVQPADDGNGAENSAIDDDAVPNSAESIAAD